MTYLINSLRHSEVKCSSGLGLYFHFPYCSSRCPYCHFTITTAEVEHDAYLSAGLAELESRVQYLTTIGWSPQPLRSLYIGGGTPGLWDPRAIGALIKRAGDLLGFEPEAEITIEANPGEAHDELISEWAEVGVNRLSLGAQSMRREALARLGRSHEPADTQRVVERAHRAGIKRVSVDLMHGLSGEGVSEALYDLESALALKPTHISLYQLTIEPQTSFYARTMRGEELLAPDERLLEIYHALEDRLEREGFKLYEVSNAAPPGEESKHNLLYWTMGQYLGVGVGAHGRVDLPNDAPHSSEAKRGLRWQNMRSTRDYLSAYSAPLRPKLTSIEEERQWLSDESLDEERVLVGLRLAQGLIVTPSLDQRFGAHAAQLIERGLLQCDLPTRDAPWGRWRATQRGRELLDSVSVQLIVG